MNAPPSTYQIDNLLRAIEHNTVEAQVARGVWVPARPLRVGGIRERLRAAWLVFTGKADALLWRGQP